MEFHPYTEAFPLMEGEPFDELVKDIKAHGLLEVIVTYKDPELPGSAKILDGRNRFRACEVAGVKPSFTQYKEDDPVGFVWARNAVRRHLTAAQKALAATKLATAKQGRHKEIVPPGTISNTTTMAEAAKMADVGRRSIARANAVLKNAVPEVIKAVEEGKLALSPAERLAKESKERQVRVIRTVPVEEIPDMFPDPRDRGSGKRVHHGGREEVSSKPRGGIEEVQVVVTGEEACLQPRQVIRGKQEKEIQSIELQIVAFLDGEPNSDEKRILIKMLKHYMELVEAEK